MTEEMKAKLVKLSDRQIFSLFWFLRGWFNDNKEFESACENWFRNHGMAQTKKA